MPLIVLKRCIMLGFYQVGLKTVIVYLQSVISSLNGVKSQVLFDCTTRGLKLFVLERPALTSSGVK